MVTGQTKSSQSRLNLTFFLIPEFLTPKRFQINCPIEDRRPDGRGQPLTVFVVFSYFGPGRLCLIRRELNHLVRAGEKKIPNRRIMKWLGDFNSFVDPSYMSVGSCSRRGAGPEGLQSLPLDLSTQVKLLSFHSPRFRSMGVP